MQRSLILESNVNPETSFTSAAPLDTANPATSDFRVSTEIGTEIFFAILSMIGITLNISSEIATSTAPGRVLSPPISIISAPSEIIDFKCSSAVAIDEYFPPSEKLSGVTFNIPITLGKSKESPQILTLS